MLRLLLGNGWNAPMPDGRYSTTFPQRPDQQLTLLQIGRRVNPAEFQPVYLAHRAALAPHVALPIGTIETPAIDYLLPYWMGRYYGVITK